MNLKAGLQVNQKEGLQVYQQKPLIPLAGNMAGNNTQPLYNIQKSLKKILDVPTSNQI